MASETSGDNRPDPRDSFLIQVKTLWIIGLWYPEKDDQWKWIYYLHSFAVLGLFYTSILISQIVYMIQVWGDIEEMVSVLFLMATIAGEYIKMYPFICKPDLVKSLFNELTTEYFQASTTTEENIIRRSIYIVRRNLFLYILACTITCIIWAFYPIVDESYGTYTLPLQTWIPFNTNKSPQYQFAYVILTSGIYLSAVINTTIDSCIIGLMIQAGAQLDLLAGRLENIKTEVKQDVLNPTLLKKEEKYFMDRIVYCIKHHIAIANFVKNIETLFSFAAITEFCTTGFVLVVTLFQITLISPFTIRFLTLSTYMFCILIELFLYCWYGNEIILKSSYVSEAAYNSDWHICGYKKYRRMLFLLMIRTQRPLHVLAGNFIPFSIESFTSILRSSWSYFALLRQVQVEDDA